MPSNTELPDLRDMLATLLDLPAQAIPEDGNLIELGLDSLAMMRLAGQWRRLGIDVGFAELASCPTVAAWRQLTGQEKQRAAQDVPAQATTVDEQAPFDLAPMQHAYWIGREPGQQLSGVAAHFYNEFDGQHVDPSRLAEAVRQLIGRHGMLRVRILPDGLQQIQASADWPGLRLHDLRAMPAEEANQALDALRQQLSHRQLDLAAGEVFDIQLSLLPDAVRVGGTRLHINLDMVAADALSLRTLLADLALIYADPQLPLPALDYSYPRYLAERAWLSSSPDRIVKRQEDRAYWQARLADLPAAPQLPMAFLLAPPGLPKVVRRHRWLAPGPMRTFTARARQHGLTPALAMAAVLTEVLTAWSAEPRFLLNLPVFDREPLHPHAGLLVGDFTSSVLVSWDGTLPGGFAERARRLQDQFHADVRHIGHPGVDVLRDLSRLRGEQVLAPVVYTSALGLGELFPEAVVRQFGSASWIISQGPQVWMDAQVTELDGGVLVNVDAREDAFAPGVLDAMFEALGDLLQCLLDDEDRWRGPVPALLPAQQLGVRNALNARSAPTSGRRLQDGFFDIALRCPERPALLWGADGALSYGELRRRALGVAGHLSRQGVRPGDLVAIQLPKGPDQVVAVLGALAAGAVYLPVGVDQPPMRSERIFQASGCVHTLTALPIGSTPLPDPLPGDDDTLAYVLYTSGSTGEPKGVEITHAAAMNTIDDLNRRLALGTDDRTLALSALEFDLSVYDIFGPLSVGGAVICIEEASRRDACAWVELLRHHRGTVLNCVPALLDMALVAAGDQHDDSLRLRAVLLGGDKVTVDLPERLAQWVPGCRFMALGGATEAAIHSTLCEVTEVPPHWASVPYGKPLDNVRLRVVDPLGRDCPDFVPGELWIGGLGVARGYRGDLEKTAQRFTEVQGVRWYRTGDRARFWPDGTVEHLGRIDFQVKLRGHRIELGEVESALAACPDVGQAVALLTDRGLVAACTFSGEIADTDGGDLMDLRQPTAGFTGLRDTLAARLPAAMVPDHVLLCRRFPLTPNGKVDRQALRRTVDSRGLPPAPAPTGAEGEVERLVAEAWSELLEVPQVGREHNFFSLGGDSLLATRLVRRLRSAGLSGIKLAALFARPVLADFAATLRLEDERSAEPAWVADETNRHAPFPLTDVQRAYWLGRDPRFTLGGIGCHFYREYDVVDLDLPRLEQAVNSLIGRHDMLRVVFDDEGRQQVLPEVPRWTLEARDAGGDPEASWSQLRQEASHKVFDPAHWPLFAIHAVRSGATTRLAIGLDNLALDALSILNFYAELDTLYQCPDTRLPPIGLSFRDYLLCCGPTPQALATARAHWQRKLPGLPPPPQLPLAKAPHELGRPRFVRHEGPIDAVRWRRIVERAGEQGVTPSTVLLTAFADVLGRWSARPDLTLNLTLFDRKEVHPDIHRVMGDFTSLTLVGHRPVAGESWVARARRMQQELGEALDHREVSTVSLLRELARLNGASEVAMPVVFTSALGVPGGTTAPAGGLLARQVWGLTQTPQVWLDHQVVEADGGIALNWDVVDGLFPAGMVEDMFGAYLRALAWAADADWALPMPDLLPAHQRDMREQVNATRGEQPAQALHQAFFDRARSHPEQTALYWGESSRMSYGELAECALRLCATLIGRGIRRGEVVAVTLPKGPHQIAAVLGVLAAGAAYLPVGVDQPAARRDAMLRQAEVRFVIADAPLPGMHGRDVCVFKEAMEARPAPAPIAIEAAQLAYVIFTSGSTGEPKGVEITHHAAMNTVQDINHRFGLDAHDRVLALSALDFDLSVYDIFGLLSAGGALVLVEEDARRDARRWHQLACRHGVTVWNSVPALLDMLLTVGSDARPPGALRLALVSGDWIGLDLPGRLAAQRPDCSFVALGGATEAAIWSNSFQVGEVDGSWRSIPYGRPLRNQHFRVVDAQGRDCPDWVPGELWIGGAGVASGYRGSPDLSASKFVSAGDGRWYRTGDLGRYWPDGNLEFLGRVDTQVKLRGHRIELGEVEAALLAQADVAQAVALVGGAKSSPRLMAAVVPAGAGFDAVRLRAGLASRLPSHMLPEHIEPLRELPLSANGKVDRAAILTQIGSRSHEPEPTFEPPQGEWEQAIAAMWIELLRVGTVSRRQSFFSLGGDSLLATRFIEVLRQRHGWSLSLRTLFTGPTLAEVAASAALAAAVHPDFDEGTL